MATDDPPEPVEEEPPSSDDEPGTGDPPPPRNIKVEDAFDHAPAGDLLPASNFVSPLASLDGDSLDRDDAVAVVRVASENVTNQSGEGVLIGETITDLTYAIGELSHSHGLVRVRRLEFVHSFDVFFTSGGLTEQTLDGPRNGEMTGAERLVGILSSPDEHSLSLQLETARDQVIPRLEALFKLLYENAAVLDVQTPRRKPVRVDSGRALALYVTLRRAAQLPKETISVVGKLVGATSDTHDFKLRLDSTWNGKHVLVGKFDEPLTSSVEQRFNQIVWAQVDVEGERRVGRSIEWTFRLVGLDAPPALF